MNEGAIGLRVEAVLRGWVGLNLFPVFIVVCAILYYFWAVPLVFPSVALNL